MKEFWKLLGESLKKKRIELTIMALAVILGTCAVIEEKGVSIFSSNTVGDRELPVYCVDTTENKIALSFDAAWDNKE